MIYNEKTEEDPDGEWLQVLIGGPITSITRHTLPRCKAVHQEGKKKMDWKLSCNKAIHAMARNSFQTNPFLSLHECFILLKQCMHRWVMGVSEMKSGSGFRPLIMATTDGRVKLDLMECVVNELREGESNGAWLDSDLQPNLTKPYQAYHSAKRDSTLWVFQIEVSSL